MTLSINEIVSYGVLYYAFPVLAGAITADTGWSRTAVTAAFSVGNLVAAIAGIPIGRLLDRYGPRFVMASAFLLAGASVVGIASATTFIWFAFWWFIAGIAMAGSFYPPAFAAITAWYGAGRIKALTTLTLVAGFASTVFAPLTAVLLEHLSWREVYWVLAAILLAVTVPGTLLGLRLPWVNSRLHQSTFIAPGAVPSERTNFVLLIAAMTLGAFTLCSAVINAVPLLIERGVTPTTAAVALGLGGIGQVAGRLCYRWLHDHLGAHGRIVVILLSAGGSTALLAVLPAFGLLLLAAALVMGAVRGLFTLLQATIVTDHWETSRYATVNGIFTAPITAVAALAPTIGVLLAVTLGSYTLLFILLGGIAVLGAGLAVMANWRTHSAQEQRPQLRGSS